MEYEDEKEILLSVQPYRCGRREKVNCIQTVGGTGGIT